jgi:ABC-type branched-subunit amino acid transport system ATPase component/branched-subunit amino acid ABC-type transport system permease component
MSAFLQFTVIGIVTGCIYALTASGLVVTYTTSGIFNFAHGAIGMFAAFTYWQFRFGWHWPTWAAIIMVLFVLAPLFGALIERVLIRPLYGQAVDLQIVVTVGLLLLLFGLANLLWKPSKIRRLPHFYAGHSVRVLGFNLSYDKIVVIVVAIVVAVALRMFFSRSRTGIAMRAVVDNPDLVAMAGGPPVRIQQLSWMMGAGLAALAGILLAPITQLDILQLTLLVINGYGAAVVGRLRNLPMTILGALVIGLGQNYIVGYAPGGFVRDIRLIIPMIVLFIVLIALKPARLRFGTLVGKGAPRPASLRSSVVAGAVLVLATAVVAGHLSDANLRTASHGMALATVMLSLVLIAGYAGMASLCTFTFVGLGAWAMAHAGGTAGSPIGLLAAAAFAGLFGLVVALPTIKLRGLYLALATLAFAAAMDVMFFTKVLGSGGAIDIARPHILGFAPTDKVYFVELAVVFAVAGALVLAVRRGAFGLRLTAMDDSPAACATLGLNINWTKLLVFIVAAALAGLGGALYAAVPGKVSGNEFNPLQSLVVLLLARVFGINTVTGVFLGASLFTGFQVIQQHVQSLTQVAPLFTGIGAVSLGRDPNGLGGRVADAAEKIRERLAARRKEPDELPAFVPPAVSTAVADGDGHVSAVALEPVTGDVLDVSEISVRFGGVQALDAVSLTATAGMVTGLIGPNGAGKTTLFNVITGLESPNRGQVHLLGEDVTGLTPYRRARKGMARTFQRLEVFGSLSARENILAAAQFRKSWARDGSNPRAVTEAIIDRVGIRAVADNRVDSMPTGTARLVELGRALAARPRLLLLDEPGSGLNHEETLTLGNLLLEIASDGTAILLVEHDVELVMRICQRITVLDFGRIIAEGTAREIQRNPAVQAAYLGADTSELEIVHAPA